MTATAVAKAPKQDPMIGFTEEGVMRFQSYADVVRFADRICRTEFVPTVFRGKPENTAIAMIYGMELGLNPMHALWAIHIINGTPALSVNGKMALAYAKNLVEAFKEEKGLDKRGYPWASCMVKRRGVDGSVSWKYTWGQAVRAGLDKKDNYRKNPEAMVVARARGRVFSGAFPDVFGGLYTPEEVEEFARPAEATVREVELGEVFDQTAGNGSRKDEAPQPAEAAEDDVGGFGEPPWGEEPIDPPHGDPEPQEAPQEAFQPELLPRDPTEQTREEAMEEIDAAVKELRGRGRRVRVNPMLGDWPDQAVFEERDRWRKALQDAPKTK